MTRKKDFLEGHKRRFEYAKVPILLLLVALAIGSIIGFLIFNTYYGNELTDLLKVYNHVHHPTSPLSGALGKEKEELAKMAVNKARSDICFDATMICLVTIITFCVCYNSVLITMNPEKYRK